MGCIRLSVLLTHLVLGLAFAVPEIGVVANRELLAAKRLSLRSSDPLTRRSLDTHFMRFGRSGGGTRLSASKVNVKREAYGLGATADDASPPRHATASAAPASAASLTCVPDADTDGRVICYTPFNVSRHFLLVTERGDGDGGNSVQQQRRRRRRMMGNRGDGQRDGAAVLDEVVDADSAAGRATDDDEDVGGDGPHENVQKDGRNGTTRRSRVRRANKLRFGRSTASEQRDVDAFARFGRRHDNFMRLGRANDKKNEWPNRQLQFGMSNANAAAATATSQDDKRASQNFLRFGRAPVPVPKAVRRRPEEDDESVVDDGPVAARVDRRGPADMNRLRLGRSSEQIGARVARRHGNFMRLGRDGTGGGDGDGDDDNNENDNADNTDGAKQRQLETEEEKVEEEQAQEEGSAASAADSPFVGRATRRHGNFMRLGRSSGGGGGDDDSDLNLNLDMFRETRRRDSFLRLGRGA